MSDTPKGDPPFIKTMALILALFIVLLLLGEEPRPTAFLTFAALVALAWLLVRVLVKTGRWLVRPSGTRREPLRSWGPTGSRPSPPVDAATIRKQIDARYQRKLKQIDGLRLADDEKDDLKTKAERDYLREMEPLLEG